MMNGHWRQCFVYLAALALGSILLCMAMGLVAPGFMDLHACLLTVTLLSLVWVVVYAYRTNLNNIFITVGLFLCTVVFLPTTNYIFNSILKPHQQDRILSFLGIISDPLGTDYNVNQSKIAIGSGGFLGKGFLQGTQIKYGFVPERHTDFIFCTVGEEWGFVGTMVVLALLCLLILRLMRMGERQQEPFGRIYCYCVAAILLFHVLVNVGMTIGVCLRTRSPRADGSTATMSLRRRRTIRYGNCWPISSATRSSASFCWLRCSRSPSVSCIRISPSPLVLSVRLF